MPSIFQKNDDNPSIHFIINPCLLGLILVASTERGICAIFLGDDSKSLVQALKDRFPKIPLINSNHKKLGETVEVLINFIKKPNINLDLPLDIQGTTFQKRVWKTLKKIPVGNTTSYSKIAQHMGIAKSYRAVAQACAANKIAIAIPCHRVLCNDGSISDYHWGVKRKRQLLQIERNIINIDTKKNNNDNYLLNRCFN